MAETRGSAQGKDLPLPSGCESDPDAANVSNTYFATRPEKLREAIVVPDAISSPPDQVNRRSSCSFAFQPVGVAPVRAALRALQPSPARGVDEIPITVLKAGWAALALPLTHLINTIVAAATWPSAWKEARVVPDHKPGKKPTEVASYRPVALVPAISKIVEKVRHQQLSDHVEQQGLLPSDQHGFRPGRGVDTALAAVTDRLVATKENGNLRCVLASYDFTAAFDTLDPERLILKMPWLAPNSKVLIRSYLSDRSQRVVWNGSTSKRLPIPFGVPQGSVLGPLLFTIFTSDLPAFLHAFKKAPGVAVEPNLYADDTSCVITAPTTEDAASAFTSISTALTMYSSTNMLSLNTDKTRALHLDYRSDSPVLLLLGTHIDGRLSFSHHHDRTLRDVWARIAVIRRLRGVISRGPLLKAAARALVLGRMQCSAWVTHRIRITPNESISRDSRDAQVAINDLARVLLGASRKQHLRVQDLLNRASLPTINQIVCQQAGVAAWRAVKQPDSSPLSKLLTPFDARTRSAAADLVKALHPTCVASANMCRVWNECPELRAAGSLSMARVWARQFAHTVCFF